MSVVQEKLRFDPESEIATTGLRVSLICPVSMPSFLYFGGSAVTKVGFTNVCPSMNLDSCDILLLPLLSPPHPAGEDAARCAMSSFNLRPSSVFRRRLLPADE